MAGINLTPPKLNTLKTPCHTAWVRIYFPSLLAVFAWTFSIPNSRGSHTSPVTSKNATASSDYRSRTTTQQKYLCISPDSVFCTFLNDFHTQTAFEKTKPDIPDTGSCERGWLYRPAYEAAQNMRQLPLTHWVIWRKTRKFRSTRSHCELNNVYWTNWGLG